MCTARVEVITGQSHSNLYKNLANEIIRAAFGELPDSTPSNGVTPSNNMQSVSPTAAALSAS